MKPVYFASSFGQEDWRGIYESDDGSDGIDYSGSSENKSDKDDPTYNHNVFNYKKT